MPFFDRLPPVQAFGVWDAPITDGAAWLDEVPDLDCQFCGEHFQPGDNGAIMPMGYAQHRECGFRMVMGGIGHHIDHARYCKGELGSDAGLSRRESALLVWKLLINGEPVTLDEITSDEVDALLDEAQTLEPPRGYDPASAQEALKVGADLLRSEGIDPAWPGFGEAAE